MNRREMLRLTGAAALAAAGGAVLADGGRRVKVGQVGTAHSHASGKLAALRKMGEVFDLVGVVERTRSVAGRRRGGRSTRGCGGSVASSC